MDSLRTRRAAARGPLALTAAAFALASVSGAAAQTRECTGGGNTVGISIDGSGSIQPGPFNSALTQIASFIDSTSEFSTTGTANVNLYYANVWNATVTDTTGSFQTNAGGAASAAVEALPYPGGSTNIAAGIEDLTEQFAAAPADAGARIAIVFTDGRASSTSPLAAADALRAEGATVAAVGIGSGVSVPILEDIASVGADGTELVFQGDFGDIEDLFDEIIRNIDSDGDGVNDCEDECPDDPDKVVPGECGCGEPETCNDKKGKKFGKKPFGRQFDKKKFNRKVDKKFEKFEKDFDDDFENDDFHDHGHGQW